MRIRALVLCSTGYTSVANYQFEVVKTDQESQRGGRVLEAEAAKHTWRIYGQSKSKLIQVHACLLNSWICQHAHTYDIHACSQASLQKVKELTELNQDLEMKLMIERQTNDKLLRDTANSREKVLMMLDWSTLLQTLVFGMLAAIWSGIFQLCDILHLWSESDSFFFWTCKNARHDRNPVSQVFSPLPSKDASSLDSSPQSSQTSSILRGERLDVLTPLPSSSQVRESWMNLQSHRIL